MLKIVIFTVAFVAVNSSGLLGGWTELDPKKLADHVVELAHLAGKHVNDHQDQTFHSKLGRVLRARSQIVNGVKYELDLEMVQTKCQKEKVSYEDCVPPKISVSNFKSKVKN